MVFINVTDLLRSCSEHVAKNLKFSTALGMSTVFANQTGFPWSRDSRAANSSRRDSKMSAIRIIIFDLSWTGVDDHLLIMKNVNMQAEDELKTTQPNQLLIGGQGHCFRI